MRCKWCISLIFMLLAATQAFADVVVIVRREAQPSGNYIRVCDIARVDGPKELAREVAMTILGPTPMGMETHEITRWDIESRLAEMGIVSGVRFSGNDVVRVWASGAPPRRFADSGMYQPLGDVPHQSFAGGASPDRMPMSSREDARMAARRALRGEGESEAKPPPGFSDRRAQAVAEPELLSNDAKKRLARTIGDYLGDQYRDRRPDIEVNAKVVSATGPVGSGAFDVRVVEATGHIPGKATVLLKVKDEAESPERVVRVVADAEVFGQAVVAMRNLKRGETLKQNDVAIARIRMEAGKRYLPPSPKAAVGRETARSFKAGEPILADEAPESAAVKRGQYIVVKSTGKGWEVLSKAKAQGDGAVGDIINAEDLDTKKKYLVRITGRDTGSLVINKEEEYFNRK